MKKIAISSLITEIGFPTKMTIPLVVKTICNYVKSNPGAYSEIFLFVKKQTLVEEYVNMFEKYIELSELFD